MNICHACGRIGHYSKGANLKVEVMSTTNLCTITASAPETLCPATIKASINGYTVNALLVSRKFSDWFSIGEGNKLLVSNILPTPIARTMPSVLLVLGWAIFYFGMPSNHKQIGKTMTKRFSNKPKIKTTRNAQFRIQIILLSPASKTKVKMQSKIDRATKMKKLIF